MPPVPNRASPRPAARVVVALPGGEEGDVLVRRAARTAERLGDAGAPADLLAVHVARSRDLQASSAAALATQRALVESLGGSYHVLVGEDVPHALLEFARTERASHLVLGVGRRGRLAALLGPGAATRVARGAAEVDVQLVPVAGPGTASGALPGPGGVPPRRRLVGYLAAVGGLVALTTVLAHLRDQLALGSQLLLFLSAVVAVALVGGLLPALLAALLGTALVNYWFTPPYYGLTISRSEDLLSLVVFVVVAVVVATLVDRAARRTREAARSQAESEALATLSGDVLRGERTLPALLARARELFGLDEVRLLEEVDGAPVVVARSGQAADAVVPAVLPVAEGVRLELRGRAVEADDLRVLRAFGAQAAVSVERGRLAAQARRVEALRQVDRVRTSLLAAVGHDLRTPLSAAKSAVSSLRDDGVAWTRGERSELLATAEESLDQLDDVVSNLLDMSRLQAGVLAVHRSAVALEDVLPLPALDALGDRLELCLPDDLPDVLVDPGLLERVLANLLHNAVRYAPHPSPVRLVALAAGDRVDVSVVDRGPGIDDGDKQRVFAPFQRVDDRSTSTAGAGVGLGLAVSRGFVEAMGGTLRPEDTPGGGLTMRLSLEAAT